MPAVLTRVEIVNTTFDSKHVAVVGGFGGFFDLVGCLLGRFGMF